MRHLTVNDLLDAYARDYLSTKAPHTQRQARSFYARIRRDLGDVILVDLTAPRLRLWRNALQAEYSPGTVRRYLFALSGPLTAAVREYELLAVNPLRHVRFPAEPSGRIRLLRSDEQQRLLMACLVSRNPALYPLVLLALTTGARKQELLDLRWEDLDLTQGLLRLLHTKNGERRQVQVVGVALDVLRQWAQGQPRRSPWVFVRADGQKPVLIDEAFRQALRRAGLRDFTFHDLRHCCASYLAMSGASLLDIATILGHKTLAMVMRYSHLTDTHTRAVVERMAREYLPGPADEEAGGRGPTGA